MSGSLSFISVNKTPFKVFEVHSRLGRTSKYFELKFIIFANKITILGDAKTSGEVSSIGSKTWLLVELFAQLAMLPFGTMMPLASLVKLELLAKLAWAKLALLTVELLPIR